MKCEVCRQKEAVIHVRQIIGSKTLDLYLCEDCAYKKGISNSNDKIELSLSELLTGLSNIESIMDIDVKNINCKECGLSLSDLKKGGRLGCPECYNTFRKEIETFLKGITETIRHKGKYPEKLLTYKAFLVDRELLKNKLKDAVSNEDYEEASKEA